MEADAQKHKAKFTQLAKQGVRYYIASRCHPDVFDGILEKTPHVVIWHMNHTAIENEEVHKFYKDPVFIQGSVSVAGRGTCLGIVMGYRSFNIYGMDCSFPWDEEKTFEEQTQHAGMHPNPQAVYRTDPVAGNVYYTTLQLMATADAFLDMARITNMVEYRIHGKGLLAAKASLMNLPNVRAPAFDEPDRIHYRVKGLAWSSI
jgi:hypothetical protein